MAMQPSSAPRWDPLQIVLAIAAIFAIGSVGFFLAILWGNANNNAPTSEFQKQLTDTQKQQVLDNLNASSSTSATGTPQTKVIPSTHPVTPQQADMSDKNAAHKLDVLDSLNAH